MFAIASRLRIGTANRIGYSRIHVVMCGAYTSVANVTHPYDTMKKMIVLVTQPRAFSCRGPTVLSTT